MPIRPTSPSSLQELLAESDSRLQMSGLFSARGVGLKRFLGSVEMEAIVQAPSSLYLSVRSFFSQPARVLKTSGEVLDIQEMLPIQILPYELVDVILGRVSIGEGRVLELSDTCLRVGRPSGDTEQITSVHSAMRMDGWSTRLSMRIFNSGRVWTLPPDGNLKRAWTMTRIALR
jgi:hypothetical protein